MTNTYPIQLTQNDFDFAPDGALSAGTYAELYRLKIPAKQFRWFGEGNSGNQNSVDTRGTWTMTVQTSAPAAIAGNARLIVSTANEDREFFIRDVRSEQLVSGVKVGLGGNNGQPSEQKIGAGQDAFLKIKYKPDTTATPSESACSLSIPVTIQNL